MANNFVANIEVIERIDKFLRDTIPDCKGLGIARLLEGRHPSGKQPVSTMLYLLADGASRWDCAFD